MTLQAPFNNTPECRALFQQELVRRLGASYSLGVSYNDDVIIGTIARGAVRKVFMMHLPTTDSPISLASQLESRVRFEFLDPRHR